MRLFYSLILSFLLLPNFVVGQIYDPVDWSFSKQQISENTYELTFIADIEPGWALYSNDIYNNGVDCEVKEIGLNEKDSMKLWNGCKVKTPYCNNLFVL